jgi:hypothetical protein
VLVHRLGLLGDIFANALSRKLSEAAVLESKALASTIFTSLHGHVAAVDRDGVIIAVNESWTRFAREKEAIPPACPSARATSRSCGPRSALATRTRAGRSRPSRPCWKGERAAVLEYACPSATPRAGSRWRWSRSGGPKAGPSSPTSTSRSAERAEEEARRQREELAHALRVTTMGELAGSLAHEINQPLAVIVTSAQAAQRLLDGDARTAPSFAAR